MADVSTAISSTCRVEDFDMPPDKNAAYCSVSAMVFARVSTYAVANVFL